MSDQTAPETLGQVVDESINRMRVVWRQQVWDAPTVSEYSRVLRAFADAELVRRVVTHAIDHTDGRYPPPPSWFYAKGRELGGRTTGAPTKEPTFRQAAYDPRDPPGTIRWVVIQPDGRRVPGGVRTADEMSAGR